MIRMTAIWVRLGMMALALLFASSARGQVVISEFMASSSAEFGLQDEDLATPDWIEIQNISTGAVNMLNWKLKDKTSVWVFPSFDLPAGAFRVIFASGKNRTNPANPLHTSFQLSQGGEYLALVRPDDSMATEFAPAYPAQFTDVSYGISPPSTNIQLVPEWGTCRWAFAQGAYGTNWMARSYDDTSWSGGQSGLASTNYPDLMRTTVPGSTTGIYTRFAFGISNGTSWARLKLRVKADDGYVAYLNGTKVSARYAPGNPAWDSMATTEISNAESLIYADTTLDARTNLLVNGTNVLAIHVMNGNVIARFRPDILLFPVLDGVQRLPGAGTVYRFFQTPSPGAPNEIGDDGISKEPCFSLPGGFYTNSQSLAITSDVPGTVVRYTLDCEDPDEAAVPYTTPLAITNRAGTANYFSLVRTSPVSNWSWLPPWNPPATEIFKATVVRAVAFEPGRSPSPVVTRTYFVDPNILSRYAALPVVSLVSAYSNLFSNATGIYVPGDSYINGDNWSGNYYKDWVRPAYIEFFETNGVLGFAQGVGLQPAGSTSVASPHKGLHVFADALYGPDRVKYPLFADTRFRAKDLKEFKRFILRAWGSYRGRGMIYDPYAQYLMAESDLDLQAYRPVMVFINGEYWGLQELREADRNSWYLQSHYGIDRVNPGYDILYGAGPYTNGSPSFYSQIDEGDSVHWDNMWSFITNHDMTVSTNYAYVKTQMDVDSYILYLVHCVFTIKADWPDQNESKWRPRTPDGRWRWLQYDLDHSFYDPYTTDILGHIFSSCPLFIRLKANTEFKNAFLNTYADCMNSYFTTNRMLARFEEVSGALRPYMPEFRSRWQLNYDWESQMSSMRNNIILRGGWETTNIISKFGLTGTVDVVLGNVNRDRGSIRINTLEINRNTPGVEGAPYPWQGKYFKHIPVTLSAIPKPGYRFDHWTGAVGGSVNPVVVPTPSNLAVTAVFEPLDGSEPPVAITEVMYHPDDRVAGMNADLFEFVELQNRGGAPLDLYGLTFTEGISYTVTNHVTLNALQHAVVVRDLTAFAGRYVTNGLVILGTFDGGLDNNGDTITLRASTLGPVLSTFTYENGRGWPVSADGAGHSLVPLVTTNQYSGMLDYGGNWRASAVIGGSPGMADPEPDVPVVLNEILAHTDISDTNYPGFVSNDQIEIYNPTADDIALDGWYLSDTATNLFRWGFPFGATIGAGQWMVLDEIHNFHPSATNGFGLDKAGEKLFLSQLTGGAADRVVDALAYKAQWNSVGYGRFRDARPYWYAMTFSPAHANLTPWTNVVVSEIMYNPLAETDLVANTSNEFIEVFNPARWPVTLMGETGPWRVDGGVSYLFPSNVVLAQDECLLVVSFNPDDPTNATMTAAFRTRYGVPGGVRLYGPYAGQLSDRTDRVALESPLAPDMPGDPVSWVIVDEVIYADQSPWPPAADGTGASLERLDVFRSGCDPSNWVARMPPTAGRASIFPAWWRDQFFNGGVPDPQADDDIDGLDNLEEFTAGTSPTNKADVFELGLSVSSLTYRVWMPTVLADPLLYGGRERFYRMENATNMADNSWQSLPAVDGIPASGGSIVVTGSVDAVPGFYRGKVWLSPTD